MDNIKQKDEEVEINLVTLYNQETGKYIFAVKSDLYGILCSVEIGSAKTLLDSLLYLGSVVRDQKYKVVTINFDKHKVMNEEK